MVGTLNQHGFAGSNIPDEIEVSRRNKRRVRREGANEWENAGRKQMDPQKIRGCYSAMRSLLICHATGCEREGGVKWVKGEPGSNHKFDKTHETR